VDHVGPLTFEPAFPDAKRAGMSLRDYLAAKALFALLVGADVGHPDNLNAFAKDAYRGG
jgi:hypothetical protein